MDKQIGPTTTLPPPTLLPKAEQPPSDQEVPVVKKMDQSATLPPEQPFVAQIVNARLSGEAFPEQPGEIAPPERTLRPYDVPMLPAEKSDDETNLTLAGDVDPDPFAETD